MVGHRLRFILIKPYEPARTGTAVATLRAAKADAVPEPRLFFIVIFHIKHGGIVDDAKMVVAESVAKSAKQGKKPLLDSDA